MNKIDRRRKALLILECDSGKLTQQNLALGEEMLNQAKMFFPQNLVSLVKSYNEADLAETFAGLFSTGQFFRNVVIIGHSNRSGLKLSSDRFVSWEGTANWINPFQPHRVILLACEAGRWFSCAALFDNIPTLREIFGSPVSADKNQQYIILARVLHILSAKKEDRELNKLLQLGNFLFTKGVMFSRTRAEYERGVNGEGDFWAGLAEPIIEQLIKGLRH